MPSCSFGIFGFHNSGVILRKSPKKNTCTLGPTKGPQRKCLMPEDVQRGGGSGFGSAGGSLGVSQHLLYRHNVMRYSHRSKALPGLLPHHFRFTSRRAARPHEKSKVANAMIAHTRCYMVVSLNRGTPMWSPKYYSPYYMEPQKGTPNLGKLPHGRPIIVEVSFCASWKYFAAVGAALC